MDDHRKLLDQRKRRPTGGLPIVVFKVSNKKIQQNNRSVQLRLRFQIKSLHRTHVLVLLINCSATQLPICPVFSSICPRHPSNSLLVDAKTPGILLKLLLDALPFSTFSRLNVVFQVGPRHQVWTPNWTDGPCPTELDVRTRRPWNRETRTNSDKRRRGRRSLPRLGSVFSKNASQASCRVHRSLEVTVQDERQNCSVSRSD